MNIDPIVITFDEPGCYENRADRPSGLFRPMTQAEEDWLEEKWVDTQLQIGPVYPE